VAADAAVVHAGAVGDGGDIGGGIDLEDDVAFFSGFIVVEDAVPAFVLVVGLDVGFLGKEGLVFAAVSSGQKTMDSDWSPLPTKTVFLPRWRVGWVWLLISVMVSKATDLRAVPGSSVILTSHFVGAVDFVNELEFDGLLGGDGERLTLSGAFFTSFHCTPLVVETDTETSPLASA